MNGVCGELASAFCKFFLSDHKNRIILDILSSADYPNIDLDILTYNFCHNTRQILKL